MGWQQLLEQGPWAVVAFLMAAVGRGDLRLKREVTEKDTANTKLEASNLALQTELKTVTTAAAAAIRAEQEATRAEMAELRKTNNELVTAISTKAANP